MGFGSRAILARVTKQIVTIFSKTCDKFLEQLCMRFFFFYVYLFHLDHLPVHRSKEFGQNRILKMTSLYAMTRNWSNENPNTALKIKTGNN